jgi:dTMP kinase
VQLIKKPVYVAIDGIDGCGKSTQARKLVEYLNSLGHNTISTREPGGTKTGKILRNLLISKEFDIEPNSEIFIYSADRLEHQMKKIIPNLKKNISIVSDRFLPSTYAYQIFGRNLDKTLLDTLVTYSVKKMPDFTFIIDISPDKALERALRRLKRDNKMDDEGKFESLGVEFFEKVRKGFLWYAENFDNVKVINGNNNIDEIFYDIITELKGS